MLGDALRRIGKRYGDDLTGYERQAKPERSTTSTKCLGGADPYGPSSFMSARRTPMSFRAIPESATQWCFPSPPFFLA